MWNGIGFIYQAMEWLFCRGAFCLPTWGCFLVGMAAVWIMVHRPTYQEMVHGRDNRGRLSAGGKRVSVFLGILGLIAVGLGIAGWILQSRGYPTRIAAAQIHRALYSGSVFDFPKYGRVVLGVIAQDPFAFTAYGLALIVLCFVMRRIRKKVMYSWPARRNISKGWYRVQCAAVTLLPGLVVLLFTNRVAEHLLGIENAGGYVASKGFIFNVAMTDGLYWHTLAIYMLLYVSVFGCVSYWATVSCIPEDPRQKVWLGLLTLPLFLLLAYFLVRCFYQLVSSVLPFTVLCLFFLVLGSDSSSPSAEEKTAAQRHLEELNSYWVSPELQQQYLSGLTICQRMEMQTQLYDHPLGHIYYDEIEKSIKRDLK